MITILTWYWRQPGGRTDYQPCHVNIWADMVRRNVTVPHRIACVTRDTDGIDPRIAIIEPPADFEAVRIPTWGESRPQCLRRLAMFAPDAGRIFGERFVCMDLDCVIAGNMDHLLTDDGPDFRIFRGTGRNRPYNGSMMYLKAGSRSQVYDDFTPESAAQAGREYMGSDQAWIMHKLGPNEWTYGPEHGAVWTGNAKPGYAVKFYPGHDKPWQDRKSPDTVQHYRMDARKGRCLVLGEGAHVWQDVEAALEAGPPAGVVAVGDTARLWPGAIDALAGNQDDAVHLAHILGFDDVVLCGAQRARTSPPYSRQLARKRALAGL